jgi:uncharacterized glyoxalase superfamily protein PhnB
MNVNLIPDGYRGIASCLVLDDANTAIEFYEKAFRAIQRYRFFGPEETEKRAKKACEKKGV